MCCSTGTSSGVDVLTASDDGEAVTGFSELSSVRLRLPDFGSVTFTNSHSGSWMFVKLYNTNHLPMSRRRESKCKLHEFDLTFRNVKSASGHFGVHCKQERGARVSYRFTMDK